MWTNVVSLEGCSNSSMLCEHQYDCRYMKHTLMGLNIFSDAFIALHGTASST